MPSFEVDFEVYCGTCGAGLCNQSAGERHHGALRVSVDACKHCMNRAKEEKDDIIYDLQYRINELESEIEYLRGDGSGA